MTFMAQRQLCPEMYANTIQANMDANRYPTPGVTDRLELNYHTALICIFHLDAKLIFCLYA